MALEIAVPVQFAVFVAKASECLTWVAAGVSLPRVNSSQEQASLKFGWGLDVLAMAVKLLASAVVITVELVG
jgi:hypothetical protein